LLQYVDGYLCRAEAYLHAGDMANALKDYKQVLNLRSKDVSARIGIGRIELLKGNRQEARKSFKEALDLAKERYHELETAIARKNIDATERIEERIVTTKRLLEAYTMLGAIEQVRGHPNEALHLYTQAIALCADAQPTEKDHDNVRKEEDKGLPWEALCDNISELYTKRATGYGSIGHWKEALADCDEALKANPDNFLVRLMRGQTLMALADYTGAISDLEAFLWHQKQR
jgi:tetratricopeptide (TPR) repeat protein